jgi:hypothetical protein
LEGKFATGPEISLNILAEGQEIAVKKLMAIYGMGLLPAADHTVHRQVLAGELVKIGTLKGVHEEQVLVTAERKISNPVGSKLMRTFYLLSTTLFVTATL